MPTFCITFGQKYRREEHPVLGNKPALPDCWLTIERDDELDARIWLRDNIANAYAFIYSEDDFFRWESDRYYEFGHLGDVEEILAEIQKAEA